MSTSLSLRNEQSKNSYVGDADSPVELARLMHQDRLLTKELGLLPEQLSLCNVQSILDIGCGPGGWVLEVAHRFPLVQVTGIDISVRMAEYAQIQAETQGLHNAQFQVMDALKSLSFPENSFDLAHARLISGFMSKDAWPLLLSACKRILRPGGIICLTEGEWGGTNSLAIERFSHALTQALHLAGYGFSPDGHHAGVSFMLRRLLHEAEYHNIQSIAQFLDYSSGTEAHDPFYQNLLVAFKLIQPFLFKMKVMAPEEAEHLYQQLPVEMFSDNFCGMTFFLTAWGEKPKDL